MNVTTGQVFGPVLGEVYAMEELGKYSHLILY